MPLPAAATATDEKAEAESATQRDKSKEAAKKEIGESKAPQDQADRSLRALVSSCVCL